MKKKSLRKKSSIIFAITLCFLSCGPNPYMKELWAKYDKEETPSDYTVTFDTDGGSAVAAQEVLEGETAERPDNPTKPGFGFVNWYDNEDFNEPHYDFDTPVTKDFTLYAKWSNTVYTVTFAANGGSPEPEPETVGEGGTASRPNPAPTKDGFALGGWYTDDNFANAWDFENDPVTANITLYAKWLRLYTVTFETGGGSAVAGHEVPEGDKLERPGNPTRPGFGFVNWYDNEDFNEPHHDFNTPVTKDITLYAKWSETFYTVTFDSGGGSAVASETVGEGGSPSKPDPDPVKDGYNFDGWYTDNNTFANAWDFDNDTVSEDITLYAKWSEIPPTVGVSNGTSTTEYSDLQAALESITDAGTYTVRLYEDQNFDAYTFTGTGATITIVADSASNSVNIRLEGQGSLFIRYPQELT